MTIKTTRRLMTAIPILIILSGTFVGCHTTSPFRESAIPLARLEDAIVRFSDTRVGQGGTVISGTGFFLDTPQTVVTSAHVLDGYQVGAIVTGEIHGNTAEYRLRALDTDRDLALLQPVDRTQIAFLTEGDELHMGEPILVAGYPAHIPGYSGLYVTSGVLSSATLIEVQKDSRTYRLLSTDAFATMGNSGGPVLNAHGKVVGMVQAIVSRAGPYEGATLFMPIDQVYDFLADHEAAEPFRYIE
jgi:S1-C subfamily serine protease